MNEIPQTSDELLNAVHSSLCIRFGTTAPYAIGSVTAQKVGFASIPMVVVPVHCRQEEVSALIPIVRQRVSVELESRGWTLADLEFRPTVGGSYRRRQFVDENESSPSKGKRKFGCALEVHFEMKRGGELAHATFQGSGSFKSLPTKSNDVDAA